MIRACIGLPADRSGVYGLCQDWLQNHGLGVYEPQRRYGEGTLPGEWTGTGFNWRPQTVELLRQLEATMLWHVGSYYQITRPQILRQAMPNLAAMREVLEGLGIEQPWFLLDEPPHFALDANGNQRFRWTQEVEDDVVAFVQAAQAAGFEVGVAVPGPSQLYFWRQRLAPDWWIVHDRHSATLWEPALAGAACWLYNAETYEGLADRLTVIGARRYLQWSGVRTTVKGPVPVLFDDKGVATDAAWELVRQLGQAQGPAPTPTIEERLAELTTEVVTTRREVAELKGRVEVLEKAGAGTGDADQGDDGETALFYSTAVEDWRRELPALAPYRRSVIAAELATAERDGRGEAWVTGWDGPPVQYLEGLGQEVWLYVCPWAVWTADEVGGPGQWLRAAQKAAAVRWDAWLRDRQGNVVTVHGGKMSVIDARSAAYRMWLAENVLAVPHGRWFFDNAWWHQTSYHAGVVTDEAWGAAAVDLYDRVRAGGKRVILNGGWEMASTMSTSWTYPLMGACDGVCIEAPGGFRDAGGWWSIGRDDAVGRAALAVVAGDWKAAGKRVLVVGTDYDRAYWRRQGEQLGVWWCRQEDYSHV